MSKSVVKYVFLWSYDNFTLEYEESDKEYDTLQECIKAFLEDRKTNLSLMKDKDIQEPKTYYMIRKKEYDDDTIWCSDYSWSRRGNKIYLHRKDIL